MKVVNNNYTINYNFYGISEDEVMNILGGGHGHDRPKDPPTGGDEEGEPLTILGGGHGHDRPDPEKGDGK